MKRIACLIVSLVILGCGGNSEETSTGTNDSGTPPASAQSADTQSSSASTGDVAVYVNQVPILRSSVERLAKSLTGRNIPTDPSIEGATPEERIFNSACRILENQQLVVQAAAKDELKAPEDQINTQLTRIQMSAGGIDAFTAQISAQGISEEDIREEIANQILSTQYFSKLGESIVVTPEEVNDYYETSGLYTEQAQVRARHILKTLNANADEVAKNAVLADILRVKGRVDAGEAFEDVAKLESQGPSAPNGGDLGYFNRGAMVPPFDEVAFTLEVNEVSEPVLTQFGYHLIQVVDKRSSPTRTLEQCTTEIELRLKNEKNQQMIQDEVERLRTEAQIVYP